MKQMAIGAPDIQRDEMTFRFEDEVFTFTVLDVWDHINWNPRTGYYEADVRKLRKLAKGKH